MILIIHNDNPENKLTDKVALNFRAMKQLGFSFTETFKKMAQIVLQSSSSGTALKLWTIFSHKWCPFGQIVQTILILKYPGY